MATWSYVALIVRISLWVIIQVLIVRMFLAAVVLDLNWPDKGNVDKTVFFVAVVGPVIIVGKEIREKNISWPQTNSMGDHARQEEETNVLGHLPCNAKDRGYFGTVRQQSP